MKISRRTWLSGMTAAPLLSAQQRLNLPDYQPKSMLVLPEHAVERSRYPVIDIHTHLSWTDRAGKVTFNSTPEDLLPVMDRRNLRTMVNLTGGLGKGIATCVDVFDKPHPGRFITFTQPSYGRVNESNYAAMQADAIRDAHRAGAKGLKVLKSLGLVVRDAAGKLIRIDDARFDPMGSMWSTWDSRRHPRV
ncbi:MAG: hypothetical protein WKF37_02765 [Bryobacteraceae bacterium]